MLRSEVIQASSVASSAFSRTTFEPSEDDGEDSEIRIAHIQILCIRAAETKNFVSDCNSINVSKPFKTKKCQWHANVTTQKGSVCPNRSNL